MQPPTSRPDPTLPPPGAPLAAPAPQSGPYLPPAAPRTAAPTPVLPPVPAPMAAPMSAPTPAPTPDPHGSVLAPPAPPPDWSALSADLDAAPEPLAFTTVIPAIDIPPVQPISLTTQIKLFDPNSVGGDGDDVAASPTMPTYKSWLAEQQNGGPKPRKRPVSGRGSSSVGSKVIAFAIAGMLAAIGMFAWRQLSADDTPAPSVPVVSTPAAGG